jgi:TonB-linked SusC/RagA family outer membrane protein
MKRNLRFFSVVFFLALHWIAYGQGKTITGKVTDNTDVPIPGVSVVITGTSKGTITDVDGTYSLVVGMSDTKLTYSFIGFQNQIVDIGGRNLINVKLEPENFDISEVVVVGYGTQKKVTLTGAVANVTGAEIMKTQAPSLGNAIVGKLPGVSTVQYSGLPGGDDPLILVRGVSTLSTSGAAPLIMVDGVERSFTQIDPNEVADISVLKDASATAVFGVRGANGVILITTKRGQEGDAKISASGSYGIQTPTTYLDFANSYEYATTYNNAQRMDGVADSELRFSQTAIDHFKAHDQPILYPDMNWVDYLMKSTAPQMQGNVNITGGNKDVKYFVSVGALQQDGLFKTFATDPNENYSYNRYNYRSNIDIKIDDINSLAVNIGGRLEKKNSLSMSESEMFESILSSPPMGGAGVVDGKRIISNPQYVGNDMNSEPMRFYGGGHTENAINVLNLDLIYTANLDVLTQGLSFKAKGSYNSSHSHLKKWYNYQAYPTYTPYQLEDGTVVLQTQGDIWNPAYSEPNNSGGGATIARDWYTEASLNYAHKFGKHDVSALLLYNQSKYYYPWPNAEIPRGYVGLVGRLTYNYDSKYLVDFNMGYNGSENFSRENRYGKFPAGSIGWIVTEEPWMKGQNIVSYLKFRYSYGIVGSDYMSSQRFLYNPAEYGVYNGYYNGYGGGQGGYNFGTTNTTYVKGANEKTASNPDVTWETSVKQNIGVDIKTFNNQLTFNIDVYKENRKDILIQNNSFLTVPSALIPTYINYGRVDNKGIEITATWASNVKDFKYSIAPSFAYNRNKIVEMAETRRNYDYLYRTGHRVNQPFAYEFFDFYEAGVTEEAYQQKYGQPMPVQLGQANLKDGDCIHVDLNGDGKIDSNDVHAIGYPDYPEITFSLNANCSFKNFDFSMLWNGATNVSRSLYSPYNPQFGQFHKNSLVRWVMDNSWTPETKETATLPRITFNNEVNNTAMSSVWMVDASYLRLRNMELGYTLKSIPFISSTANLRIYANGTNLLTFTKFKGNDPENKGGGYKNTVSYPLLKVYTIGLNINF